MKSRSGQWSVLLFVVGLLLFNPPVLSIFSMPQLLFGIPVLYLYIFAAWAGVIVLLSLSVSRLTEPEEELTLSLPESSEQEDLVASLGAKQDAATPPDRSEG